MTWILIGARDDVKLPDRAGDIAEPLDIN